MAPTKYYLQKELNIKTVFTMAHGVVDPDCANGEFISTNVKPYSLYQKKDFSRLYHSSSWKVSVVLNITNRNQVISIPIQTCHNPS